MNLYTNLFRYLFYYKGMQDVNVNVTCLPVVCLSLSTTCHELDFSGPL